MGPGVGLGGGSGNPQSASTVSQETEGPVMLSNIVPISPIQARDEQDSNEESERTDAETLFEVI